MSDDTTATTTGGEGGSEGGSARDDEERLLIEVVAEPGLDPALVPTDAEVAELLAMLEEAGKDDDGWPVEVWTCVEEGCPRTSADTEGGRMVRHEGVPWWACPEHAPVYEAKEPQHHWSRTVEVDGAVFEYSALASDDPATAAALDEMVRAVARAMKPCAECADGEAAHGPSCPCACHGWKGRERVPTWWP